MSGPRRRSAAENGLGSLASGDIDVVQHLLVLRDVGHRTYLCLEERGVADLRPPREIHEPVDELVMNRLLDQQPRSGDAGLACGGEDAGNRSLDRVVHMGVVKDDIGRLAAEFHRHLLHVTCRSRIDRSPGHVRAGERHLGDSGVIDQRTTRLRAEPRYNVDHSRRKNPVGDLHELQGRRRRVFRRLDHGGIAGRKQRSELPGKQKKRRVPGHDARAHAERLPQRVVEMAGFIDRDHRSFDLVAQPGIIVVPLGQIPALGAHLGNQLAVVTHLKVRQFVRLLGHHVGEFSDQMAARCRRQRRPFAFAKSAIGRSDRPVHVFRAALGDQRPGLRGIGIERFERLARRRIHPFSADEHPVPDQPVGTHASSPRHTRQTACPTPRTASRNRARRAAPSRTGNTIGTASVFTFTATNTGPAPS